MAGSSFDRTRDRAELVEQLRESAGQMVLLLGKLVKMAEAEAADQVSLADPKDEIDAALAAVKKIRSGSTGRTRELADVVAGILEREATR